MSAEGSRGKPKEGKLNEWNLKKAEEIGTDTNLALIRMTESGNKPIGVAIIYL